MARQPQDLTKLVVRPKNNVFTKTEPDDQPEPTPAATSTAGPTAARPPSDRIVPVGVGLKLSELAALDAAAADRGISRNKLMGEILRDWLTARASG